MCAGYLDKKTRSVFSGWQQRYFVLLREQGARSATLRYWDTDKSYRERPGDARGEISMRVNPDEALARRVAAAQPTMHMQLSGRLWEFRSKYDLQITKWLEAFKDLSEEAAHSAKAAARQRTAMAEEKIRDEEDIFKRPIGTKTPSLLPPALAFEDEEDDTGTLRDKLRSDPILARKVGNEASAGARLMQADGSKHRPKTPPGNPKTPPGNPRSSSINGHGKPADAQTPATPRDARAPVTPGGLLPLPTTLRVSATPPPPPPRQVGVSTPRGQPMTPRGQSSGVMMTPRTGGTPSAAQSELLTPRSRAPPVPMLSIDFQHMREPKSAQEIQTVDGTIYFRAATRVSPRNYKSFTARKFLQPDVSSDEEGGEDDSDGSTVSEQEDAAGGENDPDGALLTDDDLLDLFMKKQKRMEKEGGANQDDHDAGRLLTSLATPRGPAASQQSSKGGVDLGARALLSPRHIYPQQTSPMRPIGEVA